MNLFTKVGIAAIAVVLLAAAYFLNPLSQITGVYSMEGVVLAGKPDISGSILSNPDFRYDTDGWFSDPGLQIPDAVILDTTDWAGDGFYDSGIVNGRETIVVIHPLTKDTPRHITRSVSIPAGSYSLAVGVSNIAGETDYSGDVYYDYKYDVLVLVEITDISSGKTYRDTLTLNSGEGWKDMQYDLSEFSGKDVTITVKGQAGGQYGEWDGEWAAVDYIAVI